jgi:hypothetical protein
MKHLKFTLLLTLISSLFVGCTSTQPTLNTNDTMLVKTIDGKSYTIPKGTTHTREAVTPELIKRYTEFGVRNCKNGDITWEEDAFAESINNIMRNGTKEDGIALYRKAASEGKIGCASAH